ncbi:ntf2 and rrm domain-containing protein [Apodospora peruviana]|uniref:Ntf2 and rrm domain-containing protein n=1 Tax=Apodospora peruviana TaxID=516989 RepID=A0AAE0HV80_9PEZI|nr:ntf2 and rrm domain-containing protein [Apodospora peruviana]
MATNGNINHHDPQYRSSSEAPISSTDAGASGSSDTVKLPEEEIAWYFVEQYYTTLSKSSEKLHLFYGKKSQFIYGLEDEKVPIDTGRSAIQDRIKALDFQDCKVRVTNVDSQGSGESNILIQVIGEISNKGGEPKKFVQTFVLAQQPSGYFVLNDILRYIKEEDDEEVEPEQGASAPAETELAPEPAVEAQPEVELPDEASQDKESAPLDTEVIDKKLEEVTPAAEAPAPATETPAEPATQATPEAPKESEAIPDPEKAAEEVEEEEVKKLEDPKAPTPTPAPVAAPAPKAAAPVAAEPEKPKEPPKMTWASRAAAAAGPKPVVPLPKTATPPAPASRPPAPAAAAKQPVTSAPAAEKTPAPAAAQDGNEWQTAETKRQNRPQSMSAATPEKDGTMAYIKYVTEKVSDEELKGVLSGFGELVYFDINRQKNCAFVEFKNQAGYNAAVAANPHIVNGETIVVEQRRPKASAYGGSNFNATRGGSASRGRGGYEAGRTSSQGGRGGFPGQTRGRGGGAPRGRGPSQTGTA